MTDKMTVDRAFEWLLENVRGNGRANKMPMNPQLRNQLAGIVRQALTEPRVQEGETVSFWVVYDATTDKKYIKKNAETGALAMFDYEHEARAVSIAHAGTGYKQVTYINAAAPAPAEPICKHCGNPTMHVGDVCYGCCQAPADELATLRTKYEQLREIIDDGSESMTHDDAASEVSALRERVRELESKRNSELLFVGYTNGAQILYAADPNHGGQGSFFIDTENDTVIPLYMLRLHKHRLQGTTDGEVTAEIIEALHKAARLRGGSDE